MNIARGDIRLKSSQESLQKRGLASKQEMENISSLSQEQLIELLHSDCATTHPQLATLQNTEPIFSLVKEYADNQLILWKALICLSAFGLKDCKDFLLTFVNDKTIIGMEARRSIGILI